MGPSLSLLSVQRQGFVLPNPLPLAPPQGHSGAGICSSRAEVSAAWAGRGKAKPGILFEAVSFVVVELRFEVPSSQEQSLLLTGVPVQMIAEKIWQLVH